MSSKPLEVSATRIVAIRSEHKVSMVDAKSMALKERIKEELAKPEADLGACILTLLTLV